MFGPGLIAFLFAIGISGWTYSKMGRRVGTGNSAAITKIVVVTFIITFIVVFTLLKFALGF